MFFQKITLKHVFILLGLIAAIAVVLICIYTSTTATAVHRESGESGEWLYNCTDESVDTSNSTLKLVHIVLRHGARTPVTTYPNDPYVNETYSPYGWGHLTNRGKDELFQLGKWLRKRYGKFMEPYYSPDLVHAQSTGSPRTLMSLSTVLASFFPPRGTPMEWNPEYNWQPIPIFTEPLENDMLLLIRPSCPRFAEALEEVLQLSHVKAELEQNKWLFENLTRIFGMPIESAQDVNLMYVTLEAQREYGLKLPEFVTEYFPEKMQHIAERSVTYNTYTREMLKIKSGPFVKKMFAEMIEKRKRKLQRKLYIYAAHDWTMGSLMAAVKVWKPQPLHFAVTIIFELHQNQQTGDYYVQLYLRNRSCVELLDIPGCGTKCPLDKFIEMSADIIPNETHEERCKPINPDFKEPPPLVVESPK